MARHDKKSKDTTANRTGELIDAMLSSPRMREAWATALEAGAAAAAAVLRRSEAVEDPAPATEDAALQPAKKRKKDKAAAAPKAAEPIEAAPIAG